VGRIKGTITRTKKKEERREKATREKGRGGAPGEEEKGLLRGEVDANQILRRILELPDVRAPPILHRDILNG